jgi:hypothetical protein
MKKSGKSADTRKPVTQVVHSILEHARAQRADGPSSGLFGRDAQLSSAMTRAGVFLAKLDKASHPKRSSALRNAIGALTTAAPPRRRSWFFGAAPAPAMPNAKRIEQVLQSAAKDGKRLVLDFDLGAAGPAANEEIECRLPAGAVDPVCEPR